MILRMGLSDSKVDESANASHAAEHLPSAKGHFHARAHLNASGKLRRDEVIKFPAQGNLQCHARDHASSFAASRGGSESNELTDLDAAPFFA